MESPGSFLMDLPGSTFLTQPSTPSFHLSLPPPPLPVLCSNFHFSILPHLFLGRQSIPSGQAVALTAPAHGSCSQKQRQNPDNCPPKGMEGDASPPGQRLALDASHTGRFSKSLMDAAALRDPSKCFCMELDGMPGFSLW